MSLNVLSKGHTETDHKREKDETLKERLKWQITENEWQNFYLWKFAVDLLLSFTPQAIQNVGAFVSSVEQ